MKIDCRNSAVRAGRRREVGQASEIDLKAAFDCAKAVGLATAGTLLRVAAAVG